MGGISLFEAVIMMGSWGYLGGCEEFWLIVMPVKFIDMLLTTKIENRQLQLQAYAQMNIKFATAVLYKDVSYLVNGL